MTERQICAILTELGKLWHERDDFAPLGGFAPLTVLSLRYGLMGGEPQSFNDIERLVGVPREVARETENEIVRRLAAVAEEALHGT